MRAVTSNERREGRAPRGGEGHQTRSCDAIGLDVGMGVDSLTADSLGHCLGGVALHGVGHSREEHGGDLGIMAAKVAEA